jgi:8-oxo-dGTP diphosphatase
MELWDVLGVDGRRTGRVTARGSEFTAGEYHLIVHLWIEDEAGRHLIQRRALDLDSSPGVWAATGGCAIAGEESEAAVLREVREELGVVLSPRDLVRLDRLVGRVSLTDVWLARITAADLGPIEPGPEVMDYRWVSRDELAAMVSRGEFFRYSYVHEVLSDRIPATLTPPPG